MSTITVATQGELDVPGVVPSSTRYTERDMLDALHVRYAKPKYDPSPRYVCAEHVRSHCGYSGSVGYVDGVRTWRTMRTADFIAQDLWESSGVALHGHEVKVSRSDWLTELADPTKSEAIKQFCDFWWLVVPDASIVRDDLPDGWGLIAFDKGGKLRVKRRAPRLFPESHTPTFRASLMRAVAKTAERNKP